MLISPVFADDDSHIRMNARSGLDVEVVGNQWIKLISQEIETLRRSQDVGLRMTMWVNMAQLGAGVEFTWDLLLANSQP